MSYEDNTKVAAKPTPAVSFADNIRAVYLLASAAEIEEGHSWYAVAHTFASGLAAEHADISLSQAAAIVAACSPQLDWDRNLAAALAVVERRSFGMLGANRAKADRILAGEQVLDVLAGNKVLAFFACIEAAHRDHDAVCVDRHAWDVANGASSSDMKPLNRKGGYTAVADAYRSVAYELGLKPADLQAITWVVWRNLKGGPKNSLDITSEF